MGCMGMSMEDFGRCTPSEFYAAYEAWGQMEQRRERGRWERARMQCLCSLQPYSKARLTAHDIMQLPWDDESEERGARSEKSPCRSEQRKLSHEEIMARYREAKKRAGLL